MKIAIIGTRGIPASYGGFETFAEEIAVRLVERGHEVSVYCRSSHYEQRPSSHRGVRLVWLPSIHTKHLDSISHTFLSCVHLLFRGVDIVYCCGPGSSPFLFLLKLSRAKVFLNTDGIEWERAKWSRMAKRYLQFAEYMAAKAPNVVVADSRVIQQYYRRKFGRETCYVAYGADLVPRGTHAELLGDMGLEPEGYFLFVSRLEPENNAHELIEAFEGVDTGRKLVVVGSAPFADDYIKRLHATQDDRILFPGSVYGERYAALRANAYAYINAMEVGGTHPAILEAMGAGNCVLVSDIPYNQETIGEAGLTFRTNDVVHLREQLQWLADHPGEVRCYREAAVERIIEHFDWDRIAEEYERLFQEAVRNG